MTIRLSQPDTRQLLSKWEFLVYVCCFRTSWNSSSTDLGLSVDDGTAVPLNTPCGSDLGK